ncbi:hypothetical protein CCB81_13115 [Armatimonadetes bacterium Uphvl-Ar2]|nr:hypothetical protein CCB81_13045 [Armatimonadetes bacterium Uphvl-Ar2]ARU45030.1 hypothetical protein CCB81_13115 [Armatimonadetes bacterium Uphvl-Ar2]
MHLQAIKIAAEGGGPPVVALGVAGGVGPPVDAGGPLREGRGDDRDEAAELLLRFFLAGLGAEGKDGPGDGRGLDGDGHRTEKECYALEKHGLPPKIAGQFAQHPEGLVKGLCNFIRILLPERGGSCPLQRVELGEWEELLSWRAGAEFKVDGRRFLYLSLHRVGRGLTTSSFA